jgi:ferredoxin-NADP reductase
MASAPATLRIVHAENVAPSTRVLEIERVDGAPFLSIGGKYIIVNTGVVLAEGKLAKRAYSLMPVAATSARCRLAVKRLGDGPGSNALHAAALGSEFSFSGPWGKLVPEGGLADSALFIATDTGITSALGVAEQAHAAGGRAPLEVLWLRSEDETFLGVERVRDWVEAAGARFVHAVIPKACAPDRAVAAWAHAGARVLEMAPRVLLGAGDGAIVHPLRERFPLESSGVREVRIECFFHNPERKISGPTSP